VPAPAVIPALRAYINAVAVKGFVVELRADSASATSNPLGLGQALAAREHHPETNSWDRPLGSHAMYAEGARVFYCD
jgi:hypothetical protein